MSGSGIAFVVVADGCGGDADLSDFGIELVIAAGDFDDGDGDGNVLDSGIASAVDDFDNFDANEFEFGIAFGLVVGIVFDFAVGIDFGRSFGVVKPVDFCY